MILLTVMGQALALAQSDMNATRSRGAESVRWLGRAHHVHVEAAADAVLEAAIAGGDKKELGMAMGKASWLSSLQVNDKAHKAVLLGRRAIKVHLRQLQNERLAKEQREQREQWHHQVRQPRRLSNNAPPNPQHPPNPFHQLARAAGGPSAPSPRPPRPRPHPRGPRTRAPPSRRARGRHARAS